MTNDSNDWKEKYPNANHAPRQGCKKCKGIGYYQNSLGYESPCICIFVSHDFVDEAAKMVGEFGRRELAKMRGNAQPPTPPPTAGGEQ